MSKMVRIHVDPTQRIDAREVWKELCPNRDYRNWLQSVKDFLDLKRDIDYIDSTVIIHHRNTPCRIIYTSFTSVGVAKKVVSLENTERGKEIIRYLESMEIINDPVQPTVKV
jgi:phage anti-repressor protein